MSLEVGNLASLGIVPGFDNSKSAEEYESYTSEQNYGASLEVNLGLGDYNLTSITAWRRLDEGDQRFAIDGSSVLRPTSRASTWSNDTPFHRSRPPVRRIVWPVNSGATLA